MRKAIVILATSVAFLLSGQAFAVRQTVDLPLEGELIRKAETVETTTSGFKTYKTVPTTVPVGTTAVSVPVKAVRTVPSTNVSTVLKNGLKTNAGQLILSATVSAAVFGVGWVMSDDNTQIQRKTSALSDGSPLSLTGSTVDPQQLCYTYPASDLLGKIATTTWKGTTYAVATFPNAAGGVWTGPSGYTLFVQNCTDRSLGYNPVNAYFPTSYARAISSSDIQTKKVPLVDSDWSILDGFVKGKDGVWQRDLSSDVCDALPNPQACYQALADSRTLTGPTTVTAPSTSTSTQTQTQTQTGTQTQTQTKTETPTVTITYGDTYIDYSPTTSTTTTTTNNNGTTTETETGDAPTVPDLLGGINGPLAGLPGEISGQASSISPVPYHSWFSMGGSCKEHTFELPVIGPLTTNYCPIHEQYVRPFLAFMFALWTFHYCFQIWRESVTRVRAD